MAAQTTVAVLWLSALGAQAQEAPPTPDGAWRLANGVLVYPSVKLSVGRDDNVRATAEAPLSATVTTLAPTLKAEAQRGSGLYSLTYGGTYTRYSGYQEDSTNHHDLTATGAHTYSARSRLNWSLGWQDAVDPRADAVGASTEPDQWRGLNLSALYSYGAQQAKGRIETDYRYSNKRYQNNLDTTANSDVDTHQVGARYFWRVMPRTQLVAEARLGSAAYRVNKANDNTDTRLLGGVTWEATAKTTGSVKLGYQSKRFDAPGKADASGATYEASVNWKPLSYSTWTLTASRAADDALSTGDYEQSRNLGLSWSHSWGPALSSRLSVSDASTQYVNDPRQDDTLSTSAGLSYSLGRRYSLGLDLARTQRDSSLPNSNYKRSTVMVSLNAAL
jgi:hypothetical protein